MINRFGKFKESRSRGFTLIELLVALLVFLFVITVAIDIFSSGISSYRRATSQQEVIESGRFLLEYISKELRFSQILNDDGATLSLQAINSDGENVNYFFDNSTKQLKKDGLVLNNKNMDIKGSFYVERVTSTSHPSVTMVLKIWDHREKIEYETSINLQTTVSVRTTF